MSVVIHLGYQGIDKRKEHLKSAFRIMNAGVKRLPSSICSTSFE